MNLSSKPAYVVGAAETPLGQVLNHNEFSMVQQAMFEALEEAGLTPKDIDGVFTGYVGPELKPIGLIEYLGLEDVRYIDGTEIGGTAFVSHVYHAILALQAGACDVAMVAYASRQRTKKMRMATQSLLDPSNLFTQFEVWHQAPLPIAQFGLAAARHMHEYGTTLEQLAHVALTARAWAQLNPKAFVRAPMLLRDAMASPMVVDPIRKIDCCLRTDGGGVLILTREDRAKDANKKAIRVIGAAESAKHVLIGQSGDLTSTVGASAGRQAMAEAGVTPNDVDVFQPYDAFTITPLLAVEDLGFVEKGEGGHFFEQGRGLPGGDLPTMTSGGGLSYCHPGQFGLLLMIEAVRQLRHEAGERQVPDASIAVGYGYGGMMSANSTIIFARD